LLFKLGGYVGSNPEMITSYPDLTISYEDSIEVLSKGFPIGAKVGDFNEERYGKYKTFFHSSLK
jgi:hypothetical protein